MWRNYLKISNLHVSYSVCTFTRVTIIKPVHVQAIDANQPAI